MVVESSSVEHERLIGDVVVTEDLWHLCNTPTVALAAAQINMVRRRQWSPFAVSQNGHDGPCRRLQVAARRRGRHDDAQGAVRQLHRANAVPQPLFDRLHQRHGVTWLVELTCLIGHYGIVSNVLNAFEVAPTPGAEPL